jgi:hypothetical protein
MLFHLTPLMEREGTLLLEQPWRKSDFSDVVDKTAQVGKLLIRLR